MFYGHQVQDTRPVFFLSWQKYRAGQVLSALEHQIVDVILVHPEYHLFFEQSMQSNAVTGSANLDPEDNPFLHLGLHLALREQIATNRPLGIRETFQRLLSQYHDSLGVEHKMMVVLSQWLWQSQQTGLFSEEGYLTQLNLLS